MKDTKKRNKVAPGGNNATTTTKKAKQEKPGVQEYPFMVDDLTETEWAIVAALRKARQCEENFDALHKRDAWWFIREITEGVLQEKSLASLQKYCDPDLFPVFYPTALATASAIRFLVSEMPKGGEQE